LTDTLAHRGPDDRGTWVDDAAGIHLGHRRLSIIDLSAQGHQPKSSTDGRFTIAYNGEMYNHRELRAELEEGGRTFQGNSDTEVLLEAAGAWGIETALRRMVGMFAFALWDSKEHRLHLARDRFGEKPLQYAWLDGALVFASEIKAIEAHPDFVPRLDRAALEQYVRYGYVPAPRTIYEGVAKLPPATLLTVHAGDAPGASVPVPYWSAAATAQEARARPPASEADALDRLEQALRVAVKRSTVSDVPLGVFLSGGIDSSLVTALLQAQSGQPVHTFTIGFREGGFDESADARRIAERLGTKHTEFTVTPDEARAVIPLLPSIYDEPFADSSQIPTFLVSHLARSHVTVALSGDGGDELFGGYNRHVLARLLGARPNRAQAALFRAAGRTLRILSPPRWDAVARGVAKVPGARSGRLAHVSGEKVHRLARALEALGGDGYPALVSLWPHPEQVVRGAHGVTDPRIAGVADGVPSEAERFMLLDTVSYLPDDILAKVDRASMAVGLETRAPLLSHELFEVAWSLPLGMRIRGGRGKWALRNLLTRYVPVELFERPKAGFAVPLGEWLRGPLREWAEALLDETRLAREGLFHPEPIHRKWRDHLSGNRDWSAQLWVILMFQAWLQEHPRLLGPAPGGR
jgi:asparagine synthase (glutamine-hydrolysing)